MHIIVMMLLKFRNFTMKKNLFFLPLPSSAKLSISKRAKGIFNFLIRWEWENVFLSVKRESIKECFRRYWQFIFIGSKQLVGVFRSSETFKLQRNILHFPPIFCSRFDINIPRSFWSLRKFNFDLKRIACFCRERKIKLKITQKIAFFLECEQPKNSWISKINLISHFKFQIIKNLFVHDKDKHSP